jgi:hypothetical protein
VRRNERATGVRDRPSGIVFGVSASRDRVIGAMGAVQDMLDRPPAELAIKLSAGGGRQWWICVATRGRNYLLEPWIETLVDFLETPIDVVLGSEARRYTSGRHYTPIAVPADHAAAFDGEPISIVSKSRRTGRGVTADSIADLRNVIELMWPLASQNDNEPPKKRATPRSPAAKTDARWRTWAALLRHPGGPNGAYDQRMDLVSSTLTKPAFAGSDLAIMGVDRALGTCATLRGPDACRAFAKAAEPIAKTLGRRLALMPASMTLVSSSSLLSYAAAVATIGAPIELPAIDFDALLEGCFIGLKKKAPIDRMVVALLCLVHDRADDVARFLKKKTDLSTPAAFVVTLATAMKGEKKHEPIDVAWRAFLTTFPREVHETLEWEHILLAARVVLAKLGNVPIHDVARTLHETVRELGCVIEKS